MNMVCMKRAACSTSLSGPGEREKGERGGRERRERGGGERGRRRGSERGKRKEGERNAQSVIKIAFHLKTNF